MRVITYAFKDGPDDQWIFSPVNLKNLNLLVGPTGSGKSRFMNSLFNVAQFIHEGIPFRNGTWDITFQALGSTYRWKYQGSGRDETAHVVAESLCRLTPEGEEVALIDRNEQWFRFNGQELPKLSKTSPAIFLLREEELIAPIHASFASFLRRTFDGPELKEACKMANVLPEIVSQLKSKSKTTETLNRFLLHVPLGVRLSLLKENNKSKFDDLVEQYKAVFPSVNALDFKDGSGLPGAPTNGKVPILIISEKGVSHPVVLHELSSGMQKVLLILTDVMTIPEGTVYAIDEYENSLGINAVNFLPAFLSEFGEGSQFLITSHHPYLINSMPMANWSVFKRRGSAVKIESGEELALKYGPSKQDAFIQLVNDPEFSGGNL